MNRPIPHGTYTGYNRCLCRCQECRGYNAMSVRRWKAQSEFPIDPELVRRNAEAREQRLQLWAAVMASGKGGDVCDLIVRTAPIPDRLVDVLFPAERQAAA